MRDVDTNTFVGHPLTDRGNAQRFIDIYSDEYAFISGLGWYRWSEEGGFWNGNPNVYGRAWNIVEQLQIVARNHHDPDIAAAFTRHAKRSDNLPPIQRMLRIIAQDERIRRDPATFDEASLEPVTYGKRISAYAEIADGSTQFFSSRFAAKLRTEETFARKGSPNSHAGKLHILRDGEFVSCGDRYFNNRGPQECGGDWRALYGWLTSRWLIAAAPTIADATAALESRR